MRVRRPIGILSLLALAALLVWLVVRLGERPDEVLILDQEDQAPESRPAARLEGSNVSPVASDEAVGPPDALGALGEEREIVVDLVTPTGGAPQGTEVEVTPLPFGVDPLNLGWTVSCSGVSEVRVRAQGPFLLRVRALRYVAAPAEQRVEADVDRVRIELVRACRLEFRVYESETGAEPYAPVEISLEDAATRRPSSRSPGDTATVRRLRPGRYAAAVEAEGYLGWRDPGITLESATPTVTRVVHLEPDPEAGTLVLRLERPGGPDLIEAHLVTALRVEGWRRIRPRGVDRESHRLTLGPLLPGAWELLVWDGARHVGRLRARIHGGQTQELGVRVGPGLLVPLGEPPKTLISPGIFASDGDNCSVRYVTLHEPSGSELPLVWWDAHQPPRPGGTNEFPPQPSHGPVAPAGGVLGPYPFDEVVIEEAAAADGNRRRTVRAK